MHSAMPKKQETSVNFRKLCGTVALLLLATAASAQYPTKPIRVINPFAAGGGSDTVMRIVAQRVSEDTGKVVLVDNKTGASGRIGYGMGAKSAPDGYTAVLTDTTYTMMPALYASLPWDNANDLVPVASLAQTPFVIVVTPAMRISTVKQLIEYAKQNPGKVNYSSAGLGSVNHVVTELFMREAGVEMTHVPYKGAGDAVAGMFTGSVDLLIISVPGGAPNIKNGRLIGLAVTSGHRSPALPNVASAVEAGIPKLIAGNWFGLTVPKGTPKEAIDWLNKSVSQALATPAVSQQLLAQGAEPMQSTPAEFGALMRSDTQRWTDVIRAANIKSE